MKTKSTGITRLLALVPSLLCVASISHAQVVFSDDFDSGASPLWSNLTGNWTASGGVYDSQNPYSVNINTLPFNLTDFTVDVDINNVADGGIWLRSDGTGQNGVLLVTGGLGWGHGYRSPEAGTALYWHIIQGGVVGPIYNETLYLFTPETSDIHIHVEVQGDSYSAYLNGETTPATTLITSIFDSGQVGLYDYSATQTFDNFEIARNQRPPIPEPVTTATFGAIGLVVLSLARKLRPLPGSAAMVYRTLARL